MKNADFRLNEMENLIKCLSLQGMVKEILKKKKSSLRWLLFKLLLWVRMCVCVCVGGAGNSPCCPPPYLYPPLKHYAQCAASPSDKYHTKTHIGIYYLHK